MPRFGHRWRQAIGPGRPIKPRFIEMPPHITSFVPHRRMQRTLSVRNPVILDFDEFEALRLVDYEGLTQEEAARRMKISRGTVWRCIDSARRKVVSMLVEGRPLLIKE